MGSGAGFPGLALAVALPGARVDLIEAARRKCEVIERLAAAAGVANARAVPLRAEEWGAGEGRGAYDAVTARAVDSLAVLVEYAAPLLREGGVLVAWKGARDERARRGVARRGRRGRARAARGAAGRAVRGRRRDATSTCYEKVRPTPDALPAPPGDGPQAPARLGLSD